MKNYYFLLSFLLLTTILFAQGISLQGIARDNSSSAIVTKYLTFRFSITEEDGTELYAETQDIKTDNFGVFSHIIRSGTPVVNTFDDIDFAIDNLKLKVSINYNLEDIEVYNQALQYTPYAHYARNGVPTGSILPFTGTEVPTGWVLCNGQELTAIVGATKLIALIGNNAPDLQGLFLRGTGTSSLDAKYVGPSLLETQEDTNKEHNHDATLTGETNNDGAHRHFVNASMGTESYQDGIGNSTTKWVTNGSELYTSTDGTHTHNVTLNGSTDDTGGDESRPVNFGVNYIIKL